MPENKGVLSVLAMLLVSCAPSIRDPFGTALRQGVVPASSAPESLTVDLGVSLQRKGVPPFSARLYAQPYRRYRLDAFGFASQVEASYLWKDGRWTLLLNENREAREGSGDTLEMRDAGLKLPSVHALFGFLWGDPLPGFRDRDSGTMAWSGNTLRWKFQGVAWEAFFDSARGVFLEARSASLTLRYGRYRRVGNRVLPGEVEASSPGEPPLLLKVERVEDFPAWKRDPFALKIPEGYDRQSPDFPPDDGGLRQNGAEK